LGIIQGGKDMSFSGIESILGMTYPYMNPLQNSYINNYNLMNGLYGTEYTNLLPANTTGNLYTFAEVLEKLSKDGYLNTSKVEEKTESNEKQNLENNTLQVAAKRSMYKRVTNVTAGINGITYKKLNPYVTISYSKKK